MVGLKRLASGRRIALAILICTTALLSQSIDRYALVARHNVVLSSPDLSSPLQVGNGDIGFAVDITGFQTFADSLGTFSQWGWHSFPNPRNYTLNEVLRTYDSHSRDVPYAGSYDEDPDASSRLKAAVAWLRENPHRIDLARIGLILRHADGKQVSLDQLTGIRQELNLWSGQIHSRFTIDGVPVSITTTCHPERDVLAFSIESRLLRDKRLTLSLAFPYASGGFNSAADWSSIALHTTESASNGNRAQIRHTLDATSYFSTAQWSGAGTFEAAGPHRYEISTPGHDSLQLTISFSPKPIDSQPTFLEVQSAAAAHWQRFWTDGGAIDLSGSTDPRASELERRIVLSQYLTAIDSSGTLPPQETGLEMDSWYGKFHLEMHWWHEAHFALWNHPDLLERSMAWYSKVISRAQQTAHRQGYRGARWPKMVGPGGRESPSDIGDFLIWQQPHPIYLAELLYRAHPLRETLQRYQQLVFETADFMASYASWNQQTQRYALGPPLVPAQESYASIKERVENPTFELAYWQWSLEVAQRWRKRLGLQPKREWERVSRGMSLPNIKDGVYTAISVPPFTLRTDHPSMLCALGMLPRTHLIDPNVMRRTLEDVLKHWDWSATWGWDYPMMAMTAARVGEPEKALDLLLMDTPKNRYLSNGNNYQTPRLPVYLPGNGSLLYAAALMAAGWDNGPQSYAPGFPKDGKWHVRFERLAQAP